MQPPTNFGEAYNLLAQAVQAHGLMLTPAPLKRDMRQALFERRSMPLGRFTASGDFFWSIVGDREVIIAFLAASGAVLKAYLDYRAAQCIRISDGTTTVEMRATGSVEEARAAFNEARPAPPARPDQK